jgi:hypothetical protein
MHLSLPNTSSENLVTVLPDLLCHFLRHGNNAGSTATGFPEKQVLGSYRYAAMASCMVAL